MAEKLPAYYGFTRPEIVELVAPQDKRILDVGCAAGAMGGAMLDAGASEVVGIEVHEPAARHARRKLTATYQLDLEKLPALPYPDGYFDVITFADVLEHVRDPGAVLKHLRHYLRDDGRIVCSIPNVRHESVLLPLLFKGTFAYQDAGILDRTHLRFFTRIEVERLMLEAGFEMLAPLRVSRSEPSKMSKLMSEIVASAGGDAVRYNDESTAIQFIFAARPNNRGVARAVGFAHPWRGSKSEKVLVVPFGDADWQGTLADVVDRLAKADDVTIGISLAAADLEAPPAAIRRIVGERIDAVLIEAPGTDDGWVRLVAGATAVVVASGQGELEGVAQMVGTERVEGRGLKAESRRPNAESRLPSAESRTPTAEGRTPRADGRGLNAESRLPRAEGADTSSLADGSARYLDLMKRVLTNLIYRDPELDGGFSLSARCTGHDRPALTQAMIGLSRLDNLQRCVEDVLARGVPGDLIEAGAWRGGGAMLIRAVLATHGVSDRKVFVADSFAGPPPPPPELYPADTADTRHAIEQLALSLDEIKHHFETYGLLDEQVCFLKGSFKDTLPSLPESTRFAVVRLGGDMYESTMDAVKALYPKLALGGYLVVDDFANKACRTAIEDYRAEHGITDEIKPIDGSGVYWQRSR